ncbi:MAG: GNAT family N-acetyltransferase [Candidatus Hodarchaeota archaeon]
MEDIKVRSLDEKDKEWLKRLIISEWASIKVITRGKVHYVDKLPGYIALQDDEKVGLITYRISNDECEIITLNSLKNNIGIGTALLEELENYVSSIGCKRLWVITTNDNTDALRFYQLKGFRIKAIHVDSIKEARKLKPEIPLLGVNDIEILDEIELEKILKEKNNG